MKANRRIVDDVVGATATIANCSSHRRRNDNDKVSQPKDVYKTPLHTARIRAERLYQGQVLSLDLGEYALIVWARFDASWRANGQGAMLPNGIIHIY